MMTTLLPAPFHPHATDEDVIAAIVEVLRAPGARLVGDSRLCSGPSYNHPGTWDTPVTVQTFSTTIARVLILNAGGLLR
jgi:hypothetical protein